MGVFFEWPASSMHLLSSVMLWLPKFYRRKGARSETPTCRYCPVCYLRKCRGFGCTWKDPQSVDINPRSFARACQMPFVGLARKPPKLPYTQRTIVIGYLFFYFFAIYWSFIELAMSTSKSRLKKAFSIRRLSEAECGAAKNFSSLPWCKKHRSSM